jgi:hypothetical protein
MVFEIQTFRRDESENYRRAYCSGVSATDDDSVKRTLRRLTQELNPSVITGPIAAFDLVVWQRFFVTALRNA